jgi:ubiquinone/menaquinone biosynthesis C-methylase UbiE
MNCNRIAPFYRFFEWGVFCGRLQEYRLAYLPAAKGKRHALILGDGDGRFTQVLTAHYPNLAIDSIELSAGMIAEAQKRVHAREHVRIMQGDALQFPFPAATYDVVFTHFFLDCFTNRKVSELIHRLSGVLTPECAWVVSDFREASDGWRKLYTGIWLRTMYWFFKCATGLETQSLPRYSRALEAAGFFKLREQVSKDGLLASELWQR